MLDTYVVSYSSFPSIKFGNDDEGTRDWYNNNMIYRVRRSEDNRRSSKSSSTRVTSALSAERLQSREPLPVSGSASRAARLWPVELTPFRMCFKF